ncbi:TonB-dependent receptor [Luteimonas fraxinea]|uniref:TonB-dependent receptor plug domain-containing protein n=1 Tax=Luteimonas fraxinea TaxID=2901869 RepID=UPI001E2FAACA|nr:TonB-dependent receptor [Luteimonas fraxinea]UHH10118.1 TonB-dependent receptor [Luteimonas fraxinea]
MNIGKLNKAISVVLLASAAGPGAVSTARAVTSGEGDKQSSEQSADRSGRETEAVQLDTIQVTGTRIRGGITPSPVVTIGIESIREEGFGDLGEVIRAVPQNFSGGQNPGVPSLGYSGAGMQNQNITGGSALNLRGLGPDATLTLLNGKRMAYGGMTQAVDIDAIPVEAVERIEIVADGASAIYGSDAVGGVGNVILRRDFEGVAVGARFGGATAGGLATREYTATAGTAWASGGLLATFKTGSVDPIYARQRPYTRHMTHPTTLYPGSDLDSGLLSVNQALGAHVEARFDVLRTERDQAYNLFSPDGRINRVNSETATMLLSPSVEFFLPGDWSLTLGGSRARSVHLQYQRWEIVETGAATPSVHDCLCNESTIYEIGGEGPLFVMPGGEVRVAAGVGYRSNDYLHFNYLADAATTQGRDSSRFAYAELSVPLLGNADAGEGGQHLALTAALRTEDYDSFGSVTVPKLGLVYAPRSNLTMKASWGKSFKAPTLHQRFFAPYAMLTAPAYFGGSGYPAGSTVLAIGGGNRELEAERASTWTASLALHPVSIPGLDLEATWFDIDYTGRALEPITNFAEALSNPIYRQFITVNPSGEAQAERVARSTIFYNFAGTPYNPDDVVALVNLQYTNVARQRIRGLDLSGTYRADIGPGQMTLRGSASWLDSTQQSTALQAPFDLSGTLHNPPRFQARAGTVWNQGGFSASLFANYKTSLKDVLHDARTPSYTTVDVAVRYAAPQPRGLLSGTEVSIAAQNLFDREPPYSIAWLPGFSLPYDATNYSAVGRFVSLGLSKRW